MGIYWTVRVSVDTGENRVEDRRKLVGWKMKGRQLRNSRKAASRKQGRFRKPTAKAGATDKGKRTNR